MTEGFQFALAIGLAAIASAVCMLISDRWRLRRPSGQGTQLEQGGPANSGVRLSVAATVVGVLGGYAVLGLWPRWPPVNALDRLLVVVLPVTIALLLVDRWPRKTRWLRWGLGFVLAVVAVRVLLHGSVYLQEGAGRAALLLLGSAAVLAVAIGVLQRRWIWTPHEGERPRRLSVCLALAAALLVTGLLIAMAGYVNGGVAAMPWAAAVAGATVGSALTSKNTNLQGVISLATVALFGFLFIGRFFGGLSTGTAVLVLLTPLLCWGAEVPPLRRCSPLVRDLVGLALVTVWLLGILLWAKRTFDREMAPLVSQASQSTGCVTREAASNQLTLFVRPAEQPDAVAVGVERVHLAQTFGVSGWMI